MGFTGGAEVGFVIGKLAVADSKNQKRKKQFGNRVEGAMEAREIEDGTVLTDGEVVIVGRGVVEGI